MSKISHATRRKCLLTRASRKEGYGGKPRFTEPSPVRGKQPHTRWSDAEVAELIDMRENRGMLWTEIADALGRTEGQCTARYLYGRPSGTGTRTYATGSHKCSDEQLAERDAREAGYAARSYSESKFGDPPKGFSALDQRGKDKPRQPSLPVISAICQRGYEREDAR